MKIRKMLPIVLAVALAGCVPSLHSLFTDADVIFEPQLIGIWANTDNAEETWRFKPNLQQDNKYEVIYTDDDGKTGIFIGALGKIDSMTFLDLYPGEVEISANAFYKAHLLPAHTFIKIEQIRPTLKMRAMNPDKFANMLENDPNLIKHEIIDDDRVVITASTQQLQQFMKQHANDKELFGEPTELKKLEPVDPNAPDVNNPQPAKKDMPL